jgi:hypothetical protein
LSGETRRLSILSPRPYYYAHGTPVAAEPALTTGGTPPDPTPPEPEPEPA